MERAISQEERIRRAEEIYQRRKMQNGVRVSSRSVNTNNKPEYSLFKKLILQIAICLLIYFIFYLLQNSNYIFSEDVITKTREFLSYDINFQEVFNNIGNYYNNNIVAYFKENNEEKENANEQQDEAKQNEEIDNEVIKKNEEQANELNLDSVGDNENEDLEIQNKEENTGVGGGEEGENLLVNEQQDEAKQNEEIDKEVTEKNEEQSNELNNVEDNENLEIQNNEENTGVGGGEEGENLLVNEVASEIVKETSADEEKAQPLTQMEIDAKDIKNNYSLIIPLKGTISSRFGPRTATQIVSANHAGIDIAANEGTIFIASMSGTVTYISKEGGYGNHVYIEKDDVTTLYAHCKNIYVKVGDNVNQGQQIGEVGHTGNATGPHLHFEIRKASRVVNPEYILKF